MNEEDIPLMFQAQLPGRCQLQFVQGKERHPAYEWKEQWTKNYSQNQATSTPEPIATATSKAFAKLDAKALEKLGILATAPTETNTTEFLRTSPKFNFSGQESRTWEYKISWRLVSNCGQDEGFIRPIIGAKGYPYFSGSSMKGAFRRACTVDQARLYCGEDIIENGIRRTVPGILRFHGGYPTDTSWTDCLVDIVHSQENKQVKGDFKTNANAMISLHQVTLSFGISTQKPKETNWQEVEEIWDKAVASRLGSRTSAGYGQLEKVQKKGKKTETHLLFSQEKELVNVSLKGQGLASVLLRETNSSELGIISEFRPNMFKAALRGHTLRLLGGITNETTAEYLTKLLWGGFREGYSGKRAQWEGEKNAIWGLLGIGFECPSKDLLLTEQKYVPEPQKPKEFRTVPVYQLKNGALRILAMHPEETVSSSELQKIAETLIKFAMLLGGFGKSWRRIDHQQFYSSYTKYKPTIGCHWEFAPGSEKFYLPAPASELKTLGKFIDGAQKILRDWASRQIEFPNGRASSWREAWYPYQPKKPKQGGVQVWGRITTDKHSLAINWFHNKFNGVSSIKSTPLTGWAGKKGISAKTGRIWHRMYPHYEMQGGKLTRTGEYVELLTIFPDGSPIANQFVNFLETQKFTQIW